MCGIAGILTRSEVPDSRINEALKYIDRSRLVVAPDFGLGILPKNIIDKKLKNMVSAVKNINVLN